MLNIPYLQRVAVLIDGDNAQLDKLQQIIEISSHYGQLTICRIYGNWKQRSLKKHLQKLNKHKIEQIQVDRIGKDSTDKQLLIEASMILGADDADTFVIVSGDGDFRQLCAKIKDNGKTVIGISNKGKDSLLLKKICHKFHFIENLKQDLASLKKRKPSKFEKLLIQAFHELNPENNRVNCGVLNQMLRELEPEYRKRFGNKRLVTLLKSCQHFEFRDNYVYRL